MLLGAADRGLLRSDDGERWAAVDGVPDGAAIFSLARAGDIVYAGARGAVHRGREGRWTAHPLPDPALEIWSLGVDRRRPERVHAGCRPLALLASDDAGETWRRVDFELPSGTARPHTPRITAIVADGDWLWCGVEVGGVFGSPDRGGHWAALGEGLPSLDVHALVFAGPALLAATPRGIARREGVWSAAALAGDRYCRSLAALPHPGVVLCGLGDGPPGTRGAVVRSEDSGRTWAPTRFPAARSSVWSVAADGDLAVACAIGGEVFVSKDGGRRWRLTADGLGDLRAVLA